MDIKDIAVGINEYFEKQNRLYPDRRKQIHTFCCKNCPSADGMDEESADIKRGCDKKFIAQEILFVCYNRTSKLCKGLCDNMEIDQEYLDNLYNNNK